MTYLIETKQTQTTTELHRFYRENGKSKCEVITTFKPFFFVDSTCPVEKLEGVVRTELGFKSINKTDLKKVFVQKSTFVKPLREKIEEMGYMHWEADLMTHNRYSIMSPELEKPELKVCHLDIEVAPEDTFINDKVLTQNKFPDMDKADYTICCLSVKINDVITSWLCGPNPCPGVRYFKKETDMLNDFFEFYYNESPDILTAWNINFDLNYIIRRCQKLNVDYKRFSKTKDVWERSYNGKTTFKLFGVVVLDLLAGYKLWRKYGNFPLLESYSLDFVAKTILGDKKIPHKETFAEMWRFHPEKLIKYNIHDVELMDMLDKRCKIVEFFDNIRRKCHIQFEDVYKTTAMLDGFLISRLKGSIILPTARRNKDDTFKGALVCDANQGLYYYILYEDLKSLYPSIIRTFNISYETYGGKDIILPTGQTFSKTPGLIPKFMDELLAEREHYKKLKKKATTAADKELYHQRQYGTKVILNSLYGYLSYTGSRLYRREVGETVTAMGQYIIKLIKKYIEDMDYDIIYGDTDSILIQSKKSDPYQIVIEGAYLRNKINIELKKFTKTITDVNYLEIELEKVLEKILFTNAKKKYAYTLLWTEDDKFNVDKKLHVQGFGMKRSDNSKIAKMIQERVLNMVMEEVPKYEVVEYLRMVHNKMRSGEYTDEQIGFPKGISQELHEYDTPGPIIKGSAWSNKYLDTQFGKNTKPKFVYIKTYKGRQQFIKLNAKTYPLESIAYEKNIPKGFEINWEKMLDNTFRKTLTKIFDAANWDWEDLNTTSLLSF